MDLRRADLGLLVSLDALLEAQSVTAAARRLGISQPALSAHLARLRDIFDDELLVGNAHGMTLTPRAEALRGPLGEHLSGLRALVTESVPFDPGNDRRTLRIAGSDLALVSILPPLHAALAERAPNVAVEAVPLVVGQAAEAMRRGTVDLAISSVGNAPQDYPARKIREGPYRVIWREGHPMGRPLTTPEAFCEVDHLVVSVEGGGVLGAVDAELLKLGLTRRIVGRVPNFLIVPHVVRRTDCVAVVPGMLADIDGSGLCSAPLPFEIPPLEVYLSWHPRVRNDAAHRWLRELVVEVARNV